MEAPQKIEAKPQLPAKERRLRMLDQDADGVRITNHPCAKEQFRRRMEETKVLGDDFYVPNRAQASPKKRFSRTLKPVQHAMKQSAAGSKSESFPPYRVCVCVIPAGACGTHVLPHANEAADMSGKRELNHSRVHAESRSWVTSVAAWGLLRISEWMHSCF